MLMFCMDDMVPQNHMLRLIDKAIDWTFIYDLVEDKYCLDNGRPSMDPVMLIKIPMIQYLYGIKSMRQTMKAVSYTHLNNANLWNTVIPNTSINTFTCSFRYTAVARYWSIDASSFSSLDLRGFIKCIFSIRASPFTMMSLASTG